MPSFLGRMSAAEAKRIFDSEGPNAGEGMFVVRMAPQWAGFEIDFLEKGVFKTSPVTHTAKGFTTGGPTFETLPQFLQYYNSIYKRQYNRSFPRLSCFRWDLGLKETHALLKESQVHQFLLRLSTSQANCLSMGYKQADGKPCQILITLGPGATYVVGNNTFTDFASLLCAPSFCNLVPLPSPNRALGPVQVALTEYFEREPTTTVYTQMKRGTSMANLDAPTTDPSLYLMTSQVSSDFGSDTAVSASNTSTHPSSFRSFPSSSHLTSPASANTTSPASNSLQTMPANSSSSAASSGANAANTSAFPPRNSFPTKATSGTLSAFPTRAGSKSSAPAPTSGTTSGTHAYGDVLTSGLPVASSANGTKSNYSHLPTSKTEQENAVFQAFYSLTMSDRNHLFALASENANVQNLIDKLKALFLGQETNMRNKSDG